MYCTKQPLIPCIYLQLYVLTKTSTLRFMEALFINLTCWKQHKCALKSLDKEAAAYPYSGLSETGLSWSVYGCQSNCFLRKNSNKMNAYSVIPFSYKSIKSKLLISTKSKIVFAKIMRVNRRRDYKINHIKTSRVTGVLLWLMEGFYKFINTSKLVL